MGYEPAGVPPLSFGERCRLYLLAVKYRGVDAVRMTLTRLGIWTLNRGKRR
jgi:hypothetical protein